MKLSEATLTLTITLTEVDKQGLLLALAQFASKQPQWHDTCHRIAGQCGENGSALYKAFKKSITQQETRGQTISANS
jgi:hypothetical protein